MKILNTLKHRGPDSSKYIKIKNCYFGNRSKDEYTVSANGVRTYTYRNGVRYEITY